MSTELATTCEHKSNIGTNIHNSIKITLSIIHDAYNGKTEWDE